MMDNSKNSESFIYGADEPKSQSHTSRFNSENSRSNDNSNDNSEERSKMPKTTKNGAASQKSKDSGAKSE